jgi:hypothetical protein
MKANIILKKLKLFLDKLDEDHLPYPDEMIPNEELSNYDLYWENSYLTLAIIFPEDPKELACAYGHSKLDLIDSIELKCYSQSLDAVIPWFQRIKDEADKINLFS